MADTPSLDALRAELDRLDAELLGVANERLAVVERIRDAKRRSGKHLFDRAREQEVFRRAEEHARAIGLDQEVGRALLAALIEGSHRLQQRAHPSELEAPREILIVGGRGKMGALWGRLFAERGHRVAVHERDDVLEPARVARADVVMIAVPMTEAVSVTEQVAPQVRPGALLCDINSLKREVCAALEKSGGEAIGTHPMFGPTVGSLRRQKIVLCPVKPGPMAAWFEAELGRMGAELTVTDADTHDRSMAVVQVLTHFGIMVMGRALCRSGLELADTLPLTSPIYRLELAMVGRLFSQSAELYREILMGNPDGARMREVYGREVEALSRLLEDEDRAGFGAAFEEVARYFAGFSREAMDLSDHIIETIMSRP